MASIGLALSPEFVLAAACCVWPPSEQRTSAIRKATEVPVDWDQFLRVVKRQRIAGLALDGLSRAAAPITSHVEIQLRERALSDARQNFLFAMESARIQKAFEQAGVRALFVKGVTLAQLAYGTLGVKHSWDIDILVSPASVALAIETLERVGYRGFPPLPPKTDRRHERWIRFGREYLLKHASNSTTVELHWKLADNNYFLSGICAQSPVQSVSVNGTQALRTLADAQLFAYLCVHGAMHGWARVKWLADVAALIARDSAADVERRMQYARTVNADVCVAQTFLLCDRLFATPALAKLAPALRRSLRNRILEEVAIAAMSKGRGATEFGEKPFEMLQIYLSHFLLGRGWRYVMGELWNKLNGPYDLFYATIPDRLGLLYPFLRLGRWIARRGRIRPLPRPPQSGMY